MGLTYFANQQSYTLTRGGKKMTKEGIMAIGIGEQIPLAGKVVVGRTPFGKYEEDLRYEVTGVRDNCGLGVVSI